MKTHRLPPIFRGGGFVSFNGTDNYLSGSAVATSVPLTIMVDCTVSGSTGTTQTLAALIGSSAPLDGFWLTYNTSNQFKAQTYNNGTQQASGGIKGRFQERHCVVGVWRSNSSRQCWVNGVSDAANTVSNTPSITPTNFYLGSITGGTPLYFKGIIFAAAVWKAALDPDEIQALTRGVDFRTIRPYALADGWYLGDNSNYVGQIRKNHLTFNGSNSGKFPHQYFNFANVKEKPYANFPKVVIPAAQGLDPGLFTSTNTFFPPTLLETIYPGLLTNTNSFFTPVVTPGTANLSPALFTNTTTFFSPTIVNGDFVYPGLLANTSVFYPPTVTPGSVDLEPRLYTNPNSFYPPLVATGLFLDPGVLTNTSIFYPPTLGERLRPSLLNNTSVFFSPAVGAGASALYPGLLINTLHTFFPAIGFTPEPPDDHSDRIFVGHRDVIKIGLPLSQTLR